MSGNGNSERLTVYLSADTLEALKEYSDSQRRKVSEAARLIIEDFLAEQSLVEEVRLAAQESGPSLVEIEPRDAGRFLGDER